MVVLGKDFGVILRVSARNERKNQISLSPLQLHSQSHLKIINKLKARQQSLGRISLQISTSNRVPSMSQVLKMINTKKQLLLIKLPRLKKRVRLFSQFLVSNRPLHLSIAYLKVREVLLKLHLSHHSRVREVLPKLPLPHHNLVSEVLLKDQQPLHPLQEVCHQWQL